MSVVAPMLPEARVLDLFAGSGALGLEAISRGAAQAVFVELAQAAVRVIRANVDALGAASHCQVVRGDALRYVRALTHHSFDLAFADPPYGTGAAADLVTAFVHTPFASWLCVEHSRDDALPPVAGAETRRYGDTFLTFVPAPDLE